MEREQSQIKIAGWKGGKYESERKDLRKGDTRIPEKKKKKILVSNKKTM